MEKLLNYVRKWTVIKAIVLSTFSIILQQEEDWLHLRHYAVDWSSEALDALNWTSSNIKDRHLKEDG